MENIPLKRRIDNIIDEEETADTLTLDPIDADQRNASCYILLASSLSVILRSSDHMHADYSSHVFVDRVNNTRLNMTWCPFLC